MNAVPRPLALVTENPLTVVWDRSSVDSAVTNLSFAPHSIKGLDARCSGAVDIEGEVVAAAVDIYMRERIRGQIVGYRQRCGSLKLEKLRFVEVHVCEALPLMMLLPFQFDGEFT